MRFTLVLKGRTFRHMQTFQTISQAATIKSLKAVFIRTDIGTYVCVCVCMRVYVCFLYPYEGENFFFAAH